MANRFYTPVEAQSDNAGLITGLANLRLEARAQKYKRQDQINTGLLSPVRAEREFWIKEAKKEGILPEDYQTANEMQSPLRNVKKVADETAKLTTLKKDKWTSDTGEANWNTNIEKAGLRMNKTGDGYVDNKTGEQVDEYTANQRIDASAGRGNLRQTTGNTTGEGFGERSAAQKLYSEQQVPEADTAESKSAVEQAGSGKILYEDTAQGKKDAMETTAQAEAKAYDDVTADTIYDAAGKMSTNPQERYALSQSWIEDNIKDPQKAAMLKAQIMRFPEQQKYTGMRGADRGLDEAMFIEGQKGPRNYGGSGGQKMRRLVKVNADTKGMSASEVFIPENKTLQSMADEANNSAYFHTMRTAIGDKNSKWWSVLQAAEEADKLYKKTGGKQGIRAVNNPSIVALNDIFQDKPNTAQIDTEGRSVDEGAIAQRAMEIGGDYNEAYNQARAEYNASQSPAKEPGLLDKIFTPNKAIAKPKGRGL